MHLEHDHDETVHTHAHTHADGVTHTHAHTHTHDHENEHAHSHDDCGHTHCDACGGCEHSPKEELMALMKYMVGHNASHANELANLAKQLQEMGGSVLPIASVSITVSRSSICSPRLIASL